MSPLAMPRSAPDVFAVLFNADSKTNALGVESLVAHRSVMKCVRAVERSLNELIEGGKLAGPIALLPVGADVDELRSELVRMRPEWVFHTCEAVAGDSRGEAWVAALLERLNIASTGGTPECLGQCLDKYKTKLALIDAHVPTPGGVLVDEMNRCADVDFLPAIVKPVREDGSIGISQNAVVRDAVSLVKRVRYVLRRFKQPAIVEEYIDGDEYSVPVWCGGETLPIGRIRYEGFPAGVARICSYRAKWSARSWEYQSTPSEVPAKIDDGFAAELRRVAVAAYRGVGCTGYARVDLRVSTAGQPYVIDVNPNPDISPGAGFVRAAEAAGYNYTAMVERIVRYAIAKGVRVRARATGRVTAGRRGLRQEKSYENSDNLLARSN